MSKGSLFALSLRIVFSVMLHSSHFLSVRSSLKLHSSTLAFELPLSICQWRTLDISFTKLLLNIFELYLAKCNLPLLRCCALIFLEQSIKQMFFSYLVLLNVNLLPSSFRSIFCHQFSK